MSLRSRYLDRQVRADLDRKIAEESALAPVPHGFELAQNHPNPFDRSTAISCSLPQGGEARPTTYNTAGQQVAALVDGYRAAGTYNVGPDPSDLSRRHLLPPPRVGRRHANVRAPP